MQKTIILAPGKSGTTYLQSCLLRSIVFHDVGESKFRLIRVVKKVYFFLSLMFSKRLVVMPYRSDKDRRKSVFWNDFEKALMHFKNSGEEYKKLRYKSAEVFLQGCYENYPYETYEKWFERNNLGLLIKPTGLSKTKGKFFRSEIIMCSLENIDEVLSDLEDMKLTSSKMPKFNKKEEFWHRTLQKSLDGQGD